MKASLARLLQLRPGEGRLVLLASTFFLVVQAGQILAINAGDTLLFDRFGVEILPRLFMALGAATLVVTSAYAAVLGRPDRARLSLWVLGGAAGAAVLGWTVTFQSNPDVYPWLWLGISLLSAVVGTLVWVIAGEVCDARQAKRLFALFASAGILGSVLAGFLTGPLAVRFGASALLPLSASLMLTGVLVGGVLARGYARRSRAGAGRSRPLADLARAHHIVFSNSTMRLTAVSAVLFSILFFSVTYPFNVQVARTFPDETRLAAFLGTFGGIVTAVTFLVSLVVAGRVFARIGIIRALLLLPLVYLAGFVLWSIRLDVATAVVFRFTQLVLLGGMAGTAFNSLFNVVPADQRAQVRAYQSGPPAQLGVILSGALLLLGQSGLTLGQTLGLGLAISALCAWIVWRMRRTYGASLVTSLRQGITDVFTSAASPFQTVRRDAQSVRVAVAGLQDRRTSIRQLSAQLLGELEAEEAIDAVARLRDDPAPEVRRAAVATLARIPSTASARAAADFLSDPDETVRAGAIDAALLSGPQLEEFAADPSSRVQARVAVGWMRLGDLTRARRLVAGLLSQASLDGRLAGLQVLVEVEGEDAARPLIEALRTDSRPLRREAARSLARAPSPETSQALRTALDDDDGAVRRSAAGSLRELDEFDLLISALNGGSRPAQDEAILALAGLTGRAHQAALDWSARQLEEAWQLHGWVAALGGVRVSAARNGLRASLAMAQEDLERRALRGLASAEEGETIRTVARGLRSRDRELRSQALEALESIADRRLSRSLARLLEGDGTPPEKDADQVLAELERHPRPWIRALALRARAEQNQEHWEAAARLAAADPHPMVRQALPGRAPIAGGHPMETGQTLSAVERVLFLREVPIFRLLEPEDLERIAAIATERLHREGEFLCREGELGDELFVLVEGEVEVSKDVGGASRMLRRLEAGEHLGELAILREQPRSASVTALRETRTLVLTGDALRSILEDRPEVGLAMLASMAERMSNLT